MGVKVINVFLLIAVSACLIHAVAGKPNPRDSSVVEEQSLEPIHNEDLEVKVKPETTTTPGMQLFYAYNLFVYRFIGYKWCSNLLRVNQAISEL